MSMRWYHYLICGVLIILGLFCTMNLVELFSVKSAEYGTAITIETQNNYSEISKFDLGSLVLDSEDLIEFKSVTNFAPEEFNGKNKDYTILFNGKPASNIVCSSGKISGDIGFTFYDLDGNEICTSTINILIEYYADSTNVHISTTNSNDSVAYLTAYSEINGALIKVVERG